MKSSNIIRPADDHDGQNFKILHVPVPQELIRESGHPGQLSHAPVDVILKMNRITDKLTELRAAAIKVVGTVEEGSSRLAAAVRAFGAAGKESLR